MGPLDSKFSPLLRQGLLFFQKYTPVFFCKVQKTAEAVFFFQRFTPVFFWEVKNWRFFSYSCIWALYAWPALTLVPGTFGHFAKLWPVLVCILSIFFTFSANHNGCLSMCCPCLGTMWLLLLDTKLVGKHVGHGKSAYFLYNAVPEHMWGVGMWAMQVCGMHGFIELLPVCLGLYILVFY